MKSNNVAILLGRFYFFHTEATIQYFFLLFLHEDKSYDSAQRVTMLSIHCFSNDLILSITF